jgi:hypothetical protein
MKRINTRPIGAFDISERSQGTPLSTELIIKIKSNEFGLKTYSFRFNLKK